MRWQGDLYSCRFLIGHDRFTNWRHRYRSKLDMLKPKWNDDDGDKAGKRGNQMSDCQPDTGKYKPDDISKGSQFAGANVIALGQRPSINRCFPEWEKGKFSDHETCAPPGYADDR